MKLLAGLTARAGTKIDLPADVLGKPEPRVKWTKADLVLKPDDRITIDTKPGHSTLSIANTTRSDTSTYIIEAVNTSGRATATVDVNILGRVLLHIICIFCIMQLKKSMVNILICLFSLC